MNKVVFFNSQGAYIKSTIDYDQAHSTAASTIISMLALLNSTFPCHASWDYADQEKVQRWINNHYDHPANDVL